jgi:hypothetical protein
MADALWHYLENQFDNTRKKSHKRAHAQGIFHQNTLSNVPAAVSAALSSRFHAAWNPFHAKYGEWQNLRGQIKGATQALEEAFAALAGDDIESIETNFKAAYKRGTSEHKSVFPLGREPFQNGGQEERKTALDTLVARIGQLLGPLQTALATAISNGEPQNVIEALQLRALGLQAAHTLAGAREQSIRLARAMQDSLESQVGLASAALAGLRVTFTDALYQNMLQLALHYPQAERASVEDFFNLELLQHHEPDEEDPTVIPPVPPEPPTP